MATDAEALDLVTTVTARPGYTSWVGTRVLTARPGYVELALDRRPELLQFSGFFHGGVIAGLADHAAGGAVTTSLPPGRIAVTINLQVNFIAPADGDRIIARATAVRVGSTVSVANVDVVTAAGGEERLSAHCTVTLRTVEAGATAHGPSG